MRKRYYALLLDLVACAALAQGQVTPGQSGTQPENRQPPNPTPDVVMPRESGPGNSPLPTEPPSSVGVNAKEFVAEPQLGPSMRPIKDGKATYVTGGVGENEATAIKQLAGKYPVEIVMVKKSKPSDELIAMVPVTVTDAKGVQVLEVADAGPYLLLDLPNGKYTIQAGKDGESKRKTVHVSRKPQRVVFTWPQG